MTGGGIRGAVVSNIESLGIYVDAKKGWLKKWKDTPPLDVDNS